MTGTLGRLVAFYRRESVLIGGVVTAGVALVSAFSTGLTPEQVAAVATFTTAIMALLARAQVTPTSALPGT